MTLIGRFSGDHRGAAAQARKEAADAQRLKRLADEAKAKSDQEEKIRAEKAAQQETARSACSVIYAKTADKRIADLTVREEQMVKTCQTLGMYSPR